MYCSCWARQIKMIADASAGVGYGWRRWTTTTTTEKQFFRLNFVIKPPKYISFYFHLYLYINTMFIVLSCSCFLIFLSASFLIRFYSMFYSIEWVMCACLFVLVGESFIIPMFFLGVMSMPSISVVAYCSRVSICFNVPCVATAIKCHSFHKWILGEVQIDFSLLFKVFFKLKLSTHENWFTFPK